MLPNYIITMKKNYPYVKAVALFGAILLTLNVSMTHVVAQNAEQERDHDIMGQWNGLLSIQGINLRIIFHINETDGGYTSTMDSPDQRAFGIPVTTTTFDGSKLSLAIPNGGITYEGEFQTDSIVGLFKQNGISIPLTLKRTPVTERPRI